MGIRTQTFTSIQSNFVYDHFANFFFNDTSFSSTLTDAYTPGK